VHPEGGASSAVKRDRRGFTLREMAERMKDKRLQIRKVAMIGLSKVYWKHVGLWLDPIDLPGMDKLGRQKKKRSSTSAENYPPEGGMYVYGSGVQAEVWQRLQFIPGFILNCWGYPDPEERHLVQQLIQEQIIPKPPRKTSTVAATEYSKRSSAQDKEECWLWERRRAAAFLTMYQSLDSTQKQCLSSILASKAKTRLELSAFLGKWTHQLHQPALPGGKKRVLAANPVLHRATMRLLTNFPPSSVGGMTTTTKKVDSKSLSSVNLENIFSFKDKSIRRQLLQALDPRLPIASSRLSNVHNAVTVAAEITRACSARDDLKSRLDSKSPLAQYVGSLYDASATFMLLNPTTVEVILQYVANLCRHLSHYEEVINASSGRSQSAAVKDAKVKSMNVQQEVEKVCQVLVMMSKHAPRSFTEVAGQLEEWLCSICESEETTPGPSLWRDAVLSFFFQVVKSIKIHLYCTEVEDALNLRVKEMSQQLEDETDEDIRDANRRARRSSLSKFCSRALKYSIYIGESQADGNDQVDDFIKGLKEKHRDELIATCGDDDIAEEEEVTTISLGEFTDPTLACSLLAESVAFIVEGSSISDEEKDASAGTTNQQEYDVTLIRKRALCELLGVTTTLRYLLMSMMAASASTSKEKKRKSSTSSALKYLYGNFESLSLQSLSTRLGVVAALLDCFEDEESVTYSDIMNSESGKPRKSLNYQKGSESMDVLKLAMTLLQRELLGSGTDRNCGLFPELPPKQTEQYRSEALSSDERRESTLFDRCGDEDDEDGGRLYGLSLVGALKMYTAVAMRLDDLHSREPLPATTLGKRRKSTDRKSVTQQKKTRVGQIEVSSSPFKERLEEEYELTIDEEEDFQLSQHTSLEDRFPSHLADLMAYLLSIIRSNGRYLDRKRQCFDVDSSESDEKCVLLRETAGICLLQLLTLKKVNKSLLPSEWLNLAALFMDSDIVCRQNILSRLCTLMQTHCLHPRFLALPCLAMIPVPTDDPSAAATSMNKMSSQIHNALLFALKRLRVTHESLCAQVMSISASMDDPSIDDEDLSRLEIQSKKLQRTAEDNTPEGIFPYVLYLLSHPPAFPEGYEDSVEIQKKKAEGVFKSLKMVISVLVSSLRNSSGDNIALLLKQVDVIARFYQDRLIALSSQSLRDVTSSSGTKKKKDMNNTANKENMNDKDLSVQYDRLNVTASVAQQVLTGLIKTQENVQPYLGDINLPMDLFELKPTSVSAANPKSAARKYFQHIFSAPATTFAGNAPVKAKKRPELHKGPAEESIVSRKVTPKAPARSSSKKQKTQSSSKDRGSSGSSRSSSSSSSGSSVRTSSSRRRGGQAVNYQDTRDSDDEEEMHEIEELLSSQSQSQLQSKSKRHSTDSSSAAMLSPSSLYVSSGASMAPLFRHSADSQLLSLRRVSDSKGMDEEMQDLDVDVELKSVPTSGKSAGKVATGILSPQSKKQKNIKSLGSPEITKMSSARDKRKSRRSVK